MTEAPRKNESEGPTWVRAYEIKPKESAIQTYIGVCRLLGAKADYYPLFFVGVDAIDYLIFTGENPIPEESQKKIDEVLKQHNARVSNVFRHPIVETFLDVQYREYLETGNPLLLSFAYNS